MVVMLRIADVYVEGGISCAHRTSYNAYVASIIPCRSKTTQVHLSDDRLVSERETPDDSRETDGKCKY